MELRGISARGGCLSVRQAGAFGAEPRSFRGAEGDRTPDLVNAIHALSQLSYSPVQNRFNI